MVEVWVEVVVESTSPSGLVAETRDRPAAIKVKMALNCIVAVLMGCGCGEVDQKGDRFDRKRRDVRVGFVRQQDQQRYRRLRGEKSDKKESFVLGLVDVLKECGEADAKKSVGTKTLGMDGWERRGKGAKADGRRAGWSPFQRAAEKGRPADLEFSWGGQGGGTGQQGSCPSGILARTPEWAVEARRHNVDTLEARALHQQGGAPLAGCSWLPGTGRTSQPGVSKTVGPYFYWKGRLSCWGVV